MTGKEAFYADTIAIATRSGVVILRGEVADLEDSDNLVAVAAYVEGVAEVVDQLRVRSLERRAKQIGGASG